MTMKFSAILQLLFLLYISKAEPCQIFSYAKTEESLEVSVGGKTLLKHTKDLPVVDIGIGSATYESDVGNFWIKNHISKRISLSKNEILVNDDPVTFSMDSFSGKAENLEIIFSSISDSNAPEVSLTFTCSQYGNSLIRVQVIPQNDEHKVYNRMWIKISATESEKIYGGGEQYTHFQMRGHAFPIWAREQGVGRDHNKIATHLADIIAGAGGDYHTTYWPQSTFLSSRLFYVHTNHTYYNVLNFTQQSYHELEFWEDVSTVDIYADVANSWPSLLTKLTGFFGRQPLPPSWIYDGAIIGVQGGLEEVLRKYNLLHSNGVKISGIWIQDWSGKLMTSLGKRVYWNWALNPDFYWSEESAREELKKFQAQGVRFLTYINPHVITESNMYDFADKMGYFIKNGTSGESHLIDFGEFDCASVDLTNPEAYRWYKDVLIGMLELGFSGWMADFGGEYLTIEDDIRYYDDRWSSAAMHNHYSYLWAKINREALEEAGKINEAFVFMRSGYGSSAGQTPVAWAGDQNVDYFEGDGLPSVIPATLSLGMSGMGISHSDIGGYVSALVVVRNEELILRWSEMSVFTQIMRTHEGNRPDRNWQVYTSNKTMKDFAHLTKLHNILKPYHEYVAKLNHEHGWPVQRPLFFRYSDDEMSYDVKYQYMYGPDLLVAPVYKEGAREWTVYLPPDNWTYLWEDVKYITHQKSGTYLSVSAPLGRPPVFIREGSEWERLFLKLRTANSRLIEEPEGLTLSLLWRNPLIFLYLLLRKLFYYIILHF